MKTILLVRHAKSSLENFSVNDEERPLNPRGKKDAPEMAKRLLKKNILIDVFLSSPALRAKTTAEIFADEYEMDRNKIIIIPELYMANNEAFTNTIKNAPAGADIIALFSHNEGITDFANTLSSTRIDHMPTCAVFAATCDIRAWADFKPGNNRFFFFDYPKKG